MNNLKQKVLITDLERKSDKNHKDYWIIRTKLDSKAPANYFAFSTDYNLSPKTLQLLDKFPHQLVNNKAILTIIKKDDLEKVIDLNLLP